MFRWDKFWQGALYSGILTVVLSAAPFFADGKISGVGLYIKQHPPIEPPQ